MKGNNLQNEEILDILNRPDEIFVNPTILSDSYVPEKLIGRREEINAVAQIFVDPIQNGTRGINAVLWGNPGTGKTVVTESVIRVVKEQCLEQGRNDFATVFIKMKGLTNRGAYCKIINALEENSKFPRRGLPEYAYQKEIYRLLKSQRKSLILVLDEADRARNDDIIYSFSRATADGVIDKSQYITLVLITNDVYFMEGMAAKTLSSFNPRLIHFAPYTDDELKEILISRSVAFKPGVLTEDVISLCVALSRRIEVDARRAIMLLKESGNIARAAGAHNVTEHHVKSAFDTYNTDIPTEIVKCMAPNTKRVLLEICALCSKGKSTNTTQVIKAYINSCENAGFSHIGRSRVSQIITNLSDLGIIRTKPVPRMECGGGAREIVLIESPDVIEKLLSR